MFRSLASVGSMAPLAFALHTWDGRGRWDWDRMLCGRMERGEERNEIGISQSIHCPRACTCMNDAADKARRSWVIRGKWTKRRRKGRVIETWSASICGGGVEDFYSWGRGRRFLLSNRFVVAILSSEVIRCPYAGLHSYFCHKNWVEKGENYQPIYLAQ